MMMLVATTTPIKMMMGNHDNDGDDGNHDNDNDNGDITVYDFIL